jgi:hypothetical protein
VEGEVASAEAAAADFLSVSGGGPFQVPPLSSTQGLQSKVLPSP